MVLKQVGSLTLGPWSNVEFIFLCLRYVTVVSVGVSLTSSGSLILWFFSHLAKTCPQSDSLIYIYSYRRLKTPNKCHTKREGES